MRGPMTFRDFLDGKIAEIDRRMAPLKDKRTSYFRMRKEWDEWADPMKRLEGIIEQSLGILSPDERRLAIERAKLVVQERKQADGEGDDRNETGDLKTKG